MGILRNPAPLTAEQLKTNTERQLAAAGFVFTGGQAKCVIKLEDDLTIGNPQKKRTDALTIASQFGIKVDETNDDEGNIVLTIKKAA